MKKLNIYLGRILYNTTKHDIEDFLLPALKGNILQKKGTISRIKLLALENKLTRDKEYHAIVGVTPDQAATRIQKKLNRKALNGKHIAVREYFIRSWHNDKRTNINKWEKADKRFTDRRQSNIQENAITSNNFSSEKTFHRSF